LGLSLSDKLVLFPWNPARPEKRFDVVEKAIQALQHQVEGVRLLIIFDKPHKIVAKYMNACDVMVLASDHEGSPLTIREAMACNLPIVSVDVGDVRQVIGDIEGCYLCEREANDMVKKLSRVLRREERTDLVHVGKNLDTAWAADQVVSIYNLILNKRHL